MPSLAGCLLSRKLIGSICAMLTILGALALQGYFGLSDYLTGAAIATIGSLGGAQVLGQAWVDRNNGGAPDVPVFDGSKRA
jgi:hypothetical protein